MQSSKRVIQEQERTYNYDFNNKSTQKKMNKKNNNIGLYPRTYIVTCKLS